MPGIRRISSKKIVISAIFIVLFISLFILFNNIDEEDFSSEVNSSSKGNIYEAYRLKRSGVEVGGKGEVIKILPDDRKGSRHQRFILRMASGQTVLIAHNIDMAQRIEGLKRGDVVEFKGKYEWNKKGGVVHWTHHDPGGRSKGGYLKLKGRFYN